mmetsp:Transcript_17085/g.69308  ORF Transcript_17085/g.69308 Transcript_17085/m.69308 type:complete len:86 (-) Transcript_17085:405-662(-)
MSDTKVDAAHPGGGWVVWQFSLPIVWSRNGLLNRRRSKQEKKTRKGNRGLKRATMNDAKVGVPLKINAAFIHATTIKKLKCVDKD